MECWTVTGGDLPRHVILGIVLGIFITLLKGIRTKCPRFAQRPRWSKYEKQGHQDGHGGCQTILVGAVYYPPFMPASPLSLRSN